MTCSCPKCTVAIEFQPADILEQGSPATCPACTAKVVIFREQFSRRVYRRSGQAGCAECGAPLGPEAHCIRCGTPFPTYFVAEDPAERRKRLKSHKANALKLTGFSFEFRRSAEKTRSSKSISAGSLSQHLASEKIRESSPGKTVEKKNFLATVSSRTKTLMITAILVLAAAGGGSVYFKQLKAEKIFISTVMKALYRVKTGQDVTLAACDKVISNNKTVPGAPLRLGNDVETQLTNTKKEIDASVAKIGTPTEKYVQSAEKIKKLHSIYTKLHGVALAPPSSVIEFSESVGKVSAEFKQTAEEFKKSLPDKMGEALIEAKKTYRPLKDF